MAGLRFRPGPSADTRRRRRGLAQAGWEAKGWGPEVERKGGEVGGGAQVSAPRPFSRG